MKFFRKYSIKQKLLIPLLGLMIVLFVSILSGSIYILNETYKSQTKKIIRNKIEEFNAISEEISNYALYSATIISESEKVKKSYEEYYKTGDFEKPSEDLQRKFSKITDKAFEFSNYETKIHFHLPPAISFCRCWTNTSGDNISEFRKSVVQISKDHKFKKGIETGRAGLSIRGIAPIFSDSGKYYGSVEVIYNIKYLLSHKFNQKNEDAGIFLSEKYFKIPENYIEINSEVYSTSKKEIGNYYLIEKTSNFNEENLDKKNLRDTKSGYKLLKKTPYEYAVIPIISITGDEEGIIILQFNLNNFRNEILKLSALFSLIFLIFISSIILILNSISNHYIANRIQKTNRYLKKLSKGKLIKIDTPKYSDEISTMQNSLMELSISLKEKINFSVSIGKGDFDYQYKAVGQFDILGKSLIEMREKLILSRIELEKQKDIAEESSALKSQFLKNMSHEIRTPLNGIVGFSELIANDEISPELNKEYTGIIVSCSRQLLKIIDDILEISGFETNKNKPIISQVNFNDVLSKLRDFYYLISREKNINLILSGSLQDNLSFIETDENRLYKILDCFANNAFKFTEKGNVEIGYVTSDKKIRFYVKDSGIGIGKENIKKIFERFSQADEDISLKYGGLGLGLSIALENSKMIGGEIDVKSERNKGSEFSLILPYSPVIQEKEEKYIKIINTKTKILVAEDEEVNILYLKTIIENFSSNFEILHAINGKAAIEIFEKTENIKMVFMDLKMPILDGFQATVAIKKINPNIPVIAQTAYTSEEEIRKCYEIGIHDFLTKPISREKINSIIQKYLR